MTRRIVITGGGTGIGLAVAHRLLDEAGEMIIVGRRPEGLARAAEDLGGSAATIITRSCDLTDPAAVTELADRLGPEPIDVLVANAGGNYGLVDGDDLHEVAAAWQADLTGNVLSTVLLAHAVEPLMRRPGGRIIAMSSIAALRGSGSYGAAKAAINAWVLDRATALARDQITVNAVAPGFVPDTEFWELRLAADPELAARRTATVPMGRPGTPAEVAEAVAYLASPLAGWTTGQIVQVNGGTLLGRG